MANKQQFIKDKKLIRPINNSTVTNSQTIIITTAVFCLFLQRGASHLSQLYASPMSGCHLCWLSRLCFPSWALQSITDALRRGQKHCKLEGENVRTSFHMRPPVLCRWTGGPNPSQSILTSGWSCQGSIDKQRGSRSSCGALSTNCTA